MKALLFFVILVVGFILAEEKAESEYKGTDVEVLTEANFEKFMGDNEFVLSVFYAPWCGHCKKLKPTFVKVAEELKAEGSEVRLGSVDCTSTNEICEKFGVKGFPTVKFFRNGELAADYEGDRSHDDLLKFIAKKSGPATTEVKTLEELEKIIAAAKETVIFAPFSKIEGNKKFEEYNKIAAGNDDYQFVRVETEKVGDFKFEEKDIDNTIFFYKPLEEEPLTVEFSEKDLAKAIFATARPLIEEVNQQSFGRLIQAKLPLVVLFDEINKEGFKDTLAIMKNVAKKYNKEFVFGYSDSAKFLPVYQRMGGSAEKIPGVGVMNVETSKNYFFDMELTEENLDAFCAKMIKGEVAPFIRSEEIPKKNDEAWYTLVAKEYEKVVFENDQDVLILIHAPWCGHCKKFMPTFEKLAKEYEGNKDKILFVKFDGSNNDVVDANVSVKGFPTIIFYPSGAKENVVVYKGDRSEEDFVKFIKENAVLSKEVFEGEKEETTDEL